MKRVIILSLFIAFLMVGLAAPAQAAPSGYWTSHTTVPATVAGNVYSIQSASELAWIAEQVNSGADLSGVEIELGRDIDLSAHYWIPIGDATHPFIGGFNGNNKVISNMIIGSPGTPENLDYAGLFGYVVNLPIRDVTIMDAEMYLSPVSYAGCLAGRVTGATVTDCHTEGIMEVSGGSSGGLTGSMSGGNISCCSAEVDISGGGSSNIGGLIGYSELCQILDSHAGGDVTGGDGSSIGGLIGWNKSNISESYTAGGIVRGGNGSYTGGLIGRNNSGNVSKSYAEGDVEGATGAYAGGLIGDNDAIVGESHAGGNVTGGDGSYSGGLIGNNAGQVNQSHAEGDVTGGAGADAYTGGLIGRSSGEVYVSYAEGKVTGGDLSSAGGLIGYISGVNSYVNNSYARGDVEGGDGSNAGGIAGYNHYSLTANCYATGKVTGGSGALVGGFAGKEEGDASHYISYGYWNSDANYPGLNDGIGYTVIPLAAERAAAKTSLQMKSQEFADLLEANNGGIFSAVWSIVAGSNDGYPVLIPADLVWVTFDKNGGSTEANPNQKAVVRGSRAGTLPAPPAWPGKNFTGWNMAADGSGNQFTEDTVVNTDITVYAQWSTPHSRGGGGARTSTPAYTAIFTGSDATETTLAVRVNAEAGSATVDMESVAGSVFKGEGSASLKVPAIPGINDYTMEIPVSALSVSQGEGTLTFATEMAGIAVPGNMLSGINGEKAGITIGQVEKSSLPGEVIAAVGRRPLVRLALTLDGEQAEWNNPNAPVTVSVPYIPTEEELADPDHIVVWYIDGSGNAVPVPSGRYNQATGSVIFRTTHFSCYAVAYVHKTFSDLEGVEWARESIEVMASKGIIKGAGADTYSPAANITRADYLVLLVKTLGLTADFDGNFDDVQPGDYYYEAAGIAKKLGIASGRGDNRFNPRENISRQDMMVLTAGALKKLEGLKASDTTDLDKFSDRGDIAGYAAESMAALVREGLICGSGDRLNPCAQATRAEAAAFLYRIYNRF